MRAAVSHGAGDLRLETDRAVPKLGPGEVLVRVATAGICGSDIAEHKHPTRYAAGISEPLVIGHEFAGFVEALAPDVSGLALGVPVVCGAGISCGHCPPCRKGRTNLCANYKTVGYHQDGGLAEYCAVPASILLDVSGSGLTMDTLAMAQPMAVALHAVARSGLQPGELAVVIGVGGIGTFLTHAALQSGAEVWAFDVNSRQLDLARKLGANAVFDNRHQRPATVLADAGVQADVVFEVSGTAAGWDSAAAAASKGSRLVPVGVQKTPIEVPLGPWTLSEVSVLGTVAHVRASDLPEAVRQLAARPTGWGDTAPTVYSLDDLVAQQLQPRKPGSGAPPVKVLTDPTAAVTRAASHNALATA